jgi:ribosomal protein L11 methyltransferase
MQPFVKNHPVVDIGCGSGILSLAAAAMGATRVDGYDIDPEAVDHAKKNAHLSPFKKNIHFSTKPPVKILPDTILLMNMISSEQAQAWEDIADRIPSSAILITSGILEENAEEYLQWRIRQGWRVEQKLSEKNWTGWVFRDLNYFPFGAMKI